MAADLDLRARHLVKLAVLAAAMTALTTGLAGVLTACPAATPVPAPPAPQQPGGWDDGIKVQAAVDTDAADDVVAVTLEARIVPLEITPGMVTDVWSYNGQVPGPTLHARRGDRVVVTFTNSLPEPTTIHWHGLRVPAAMDGTDMVQTPVQPGETFVYDYTVPDAGTFWYHPHVNSSAQMGYGLYGAIVVTDPDEPVLGDDLVLVLSDMGLDDTGQLLPGDNQGWFGDYFGRQGGLTLVNGRVLPALRARVGVPQRWRVVNASRAKYNRFFIGDHGFTLVGVDGGLLEHAVDNAVITLPPGARADVVFVPRATGGAEVQLLDRGVDHFHLGIEPDSLPLFDIRVTDDDPGVAPAIPDPLRSLPPIDVAGAATQTIDFVNVPAADGNTYLGINGQLYPNADPLHAHVDSTEIWTITNHSNQDHPFHLHGFFFEVLDIDGSPPASRGLFDTINVEPDLPVRVAIRFDDRPGNWMFHCHIIDHADAGMMRMLMVE